MSTPPEENRRNPAMHMIRPTFVPKRRKKGCDDDIEIDYKDVSFLKKYTTDTGKIVGRKKTGLCAKHQRKLAEAIKRARFMALMPFVVKVDR